jgi:predicted HAD superfamily phosphohydrolase YqeG
MDGGSARKAGRSCVCMLVKNTNMENSVKTLSCPLKLPFVQQFMKPVNSTYFEQLKALLIDPKMYFITLIMNILAE